MSLGTISGRVKFFLSFFPKLRWDTLRCATDRWLCYPPSPTLPTTPRGHHSVLYAHKSACDCGNVSVCVRRKKYVYVSTNPYINIPHEKIQTKEPFCKEDVGEYLGLPQTRLTQPTTFWRGIQYPQRLEQYMLGATTSATHATHCNTLQHTATYCNTLQHDRNNTYWVLSAQLLHIDSVGEPWGSLTLWITVFSIASQKSPRY